MPARTDVGGGPASRRESKPPVCRFENDSRTDAPKHDVEPASTPHQRAGPAIRKGNHSKSAKPPCPVQIRAAPPFSMSKIDRLRPRRANARSPIGLRWTTGRRAVGATAVLSPDSRSVGRSRYQAGRMFRGPPASRGPRLCRAADDRLRTDLADRTGRIPQLACPHRGVGWG